VVWKAWLLTLIYMSNRMGIAQYLHGNMVPPPDSAAPAVRVLQQLDAAGVDQAVVG
jgi:hypothetical protein